MRKIWLVLSVFIFALQAQAGQKLKFCEMDDAIENIDSSSFRRDRKIRSFLRDKQIVYVSGYMGCQSSKEFQDLTTVARSADRRVPTTLICPPSDIAVENNVSYVINQLKTIADQNPDRKKIILIGLSKGGAEVLQTLAMRTEVFRENSPLGFEVVHGVTISAAIGGSVLADLVLGTNPDITERWEKFKRENDGVNVVLSDIFKRLSFDPATDGFRSLSTARSTIRNQELQNLPYEKRQLLQDKVLFVTAYSKDEPAEVPDYLQTIARFMKEQPEWNDGLVWEMHQKLSGLGTHLFEIDPVGHFSLVGEYGDSTCKRQFAYLLLLTLAVHNEPVVR